MTDKKLTITVALPSLIPIGGAERNSLLLTEQFLRKGYAVDFVIADEPNDWTGVIPAGARTIVLGKPRIRQFVLPFSRYILERKPDAIVSSMWPFTSACIIAHRISRAKSRILVSEQNPLSVQYKPWGRVHNLLMRLSLACTHRFADVCLGVSSGVADDLSRLGSISRKRINVVYNPIRLAQNEKFNDSRDSEVWQGWTGPRLVAIGSLKDQKNYPVMLEALALLNREREARLMILGVGQAEGKIRAKVKELSLDEHVIFAGHVSNPAPYLQSANLFVLSSDYEGFGNVIVEALSCGVPVVATDCPSGPAEILENGKWGRLVPVGDAKALAHAIHASLDDRIDPQALMKRAADFSPSVIADQYLDLLFNRERIERDD